MTRNNSCAVFALLVSLLLASPAGAAGTISGVGFQCTNDPQYRVWFHSYAHAPVAVAQADATALAQRICAQQFNGSPVNAKVNFSDGTNVPVSATAELPTNLPPAAAAQEAGSMAQPVKAPK
jgi:hypothetical protein